MNCQDFKNDCIHAGGILYALADSQWPDDDANFALVRKVCTAVKELELALKGPPIADWQQKLIDEEKAREAPKAKAVVKHHK